MNRQKSTIVLCIVLIFAACRPTEEGPVYDTQKVARADSAMVVAPHPLASRVGVDILRRGGNAVDATVAVHFTLAVVFPRAGNIGGGGFMVVRRADGAINSLDYREKAPLAANRDMYLDSLKRPIDSLSRYVHLASGVPGTVAGLQAAHERYGLLPWSRLLQPAIDFAAKGFRITTTEAERLNRYQEAFVQHNTRPNAFINDRGWQKGDRLLQPDLANTLTLIQQSGKAGFYEGTTADKIVAEMQRGNGIITHQDLKAYEPEWRDPVTVNYHNYRMISMPPPSSGGIALGQLLRIVEPHPLKDYGFHSSQAVHLMAEAERRVYADRAEHLGDSDFYEVPQDSLLDSSYLATRMANFSPASVTPSDSILAGNFELAVESFETTHTSIVDPAGNAVSVTTTINSNYGNKVVVGDAGFFLNNEMNDFSVKPGVPNQFGLIGAEANAIQPQKRMLSSMTPTILEKDGELFMVLGSPGGSTIITAVFQVLVNVVDFGMPLEEAVNAGRFHHQWLPDRILLEKGSLPDSTRQKLEAMGHQLEEVNRMAVVKALIRQEDGALVGAGDPRNPDDHAQGF